MVEGTYKYYEKSGGFLGARAFQVKVTQVAERDVNGDGMIDRKDGNNIDRTGAETSMYIHRGGSGLNKSENTFSAGCQTVHGSQYQEFLSSLGNAPKSGFNYVLVNAQQ